MFATTPIRLFLLAALVALLGFAFAAWSAGAAVPVLIGVTGSFVAALAVIVEVDRDGQTAPGKPGEATQ